MNPLMDFKNMLGVGKRKSYIAIVQSIIGDKAKVKLGDVVTVVWGRAKVGNTVLISNNQIMAVINQENTQTIHVP